MNFFLLSSRGLVSSVSWDPIFELEDLLVQSCNAQLLTPTAHRLLQWSSQFPLSGIRLIHKAIKTTTGLYKLSQPELLLLSSKKPNVLLVIGIHGGNLELLSSIPKWRQNFDLVIGYIFDAWHPEYYSKNVCYLDHLFVPLPEVIDSLRKIFGVSVSLLPPGADVLVHGSDQLNRSFDLKSYGRISQQYHHAFFEKFNQPGSERIYYRSTPRTSEKFPKLHYEQRKDKEDTRLLFHLLRNTKLMLAFDPRYPGMRKFPYSVITPRWFYGAATGCAIIGKRPTTPLADELLNWEDATIELPDDPLKSVEFVEELLQDTTRLHSIHKRNYRESLVRHDWRFRIQNMLEKVGLPLPQKLSEELAQLNLLHSFSNIRI